MERAIKTRKLTRTNITKLCNKVQQELNKEEPNIHQITAFRENLHRLSENVQTQDKVVLDEMLEEDRPDEELEKESEESEAYQSRITEAVVKMNAFITTVDNDAVSSRHSTVLNQNSNGGTAKRTYKLPKIEIKKFNGQIIEWLSFWSQFEKIHKDEELHDSDKFQYLTQAMEDKTRAKELVNSYPQTAENYPR